MEPSSSEDGDRAMVDGAARQASVLLQWSRPLPRTATSVDNVQDLVQYSRFNGAVLFRGRRQRHLQPTEKYKEETPTCERSSSQRSLSMTCMVNYRS